MRILPGAALLVLAAWQGEGQVAASRPAAASQPAEMVWIPGGTFRMGSEDGYPEERPVREATVAGFWIDVHEVTNRQFAAFAQATGYVTVAERPPRREQYPDARADLLVPGSAMFTPVPAGEAAPEMSWWRYVAGASWRHPLGPDSTLEQRMDHPVVHVAWEDAQAYARWAGKSLPSEAQWEWAARSGGRGQYSWGDELTPGGRWMANTFQGEFPRADLGLDGFTGTAPVGSFPANAAGLLDMIGNAWEWSTDLFEAGDAAQSQPSARRRTLRGGSFLCAANYCCRYRPTARIGVPEDTSTNHIGFRCVRAEIPADPAGSRPKTPGRR